MSMHTDVVTIRCYLCGAVLGPAPAGAQEKRRRCIMAAACAMRAGTSLRGYWERDWPDRKPQPRCDV